MIKPIDRSHLEEAAAMFKALSDPARLQTLITLAAGERNVGDLAQNERDRVGTVSARKVLLQARLVKRRREGKTAIYAIADAHVFKLVKNAIAHAGEHR
jgi:ArsR family transcriptional regulator